MSLVIEKASPTDAAKILGFLKQIGSETENLSFSAEGLPFSVESEASFLSKIESSSDEVFLVAKKDGKIVGNASLTRFPRRMNHRGDFSVAVVKEHWNKGIASELLNRIIEFAKTHSFEIIELQVRSDNAAAIHVYEKFGFKKMGTHPFFFKINNQNVAFDYMYLIL